MKIGKKFLVATFLAILISSLAVPLFTPVAAQITQGKIKQSGEWKKIETDIITVLFPASGRKPMFLWWYTKNPDQIYVVKYQGLIEYFTFPEFGFHPEFYKRRHHAVWLRLYETFIAPKLGGLHWHLRMKLMNISDSSLMTLYENWHPPYLPFAACTWRLTDVEEIIGDGEVLGLAFAFNLTTAPPRFKFAENNVAIKVRFYYKPVEEIDVDNLYKYDVSAGEMKMDFIVNGWKWNIDAIKPLLDELRENGVKIPTGKSRLALWINLASINVTKIEIAKSNPETIEEMSTASKMKVEGKTEPISIVNNDTATQDEKPLTIERPRIKLQFVKNDTTLAGFFRFIASAKITNSSGAYAVPVKAAYISGGAHMRLYIGYPYFGDGSLEHDPSIGVNVPEASGTPQYTVEVPSGKDITPQVIGKFVPPLVNWQLAVVLVGAVSIIAVMVLAAKWKKKVVNVVGAS